MCGRYALALRAGQVRSRLVETNMPTQDAPDDDAFRDTYNFAPGYFGLVYRAEGPDRGADDSHGKHRDADGGAQDESSGAGQDKSSDGNGQDENPDAGQDKGSDDPKEHEAQEKAGNARTEHAAGEQHYKLQAMKWGLVPFWTKRQPDYGTTMRTINCRDDSLAQAGGMWASMKRKKRCVVVAQGFYEWQKKNNGRERIPHFVKRADGQLMCFAGLWDCVRYEDSDSEPLYTYTIVTTDANKQLGFLHDRMPVILDNGSAAMFRWLDRTQTEWTKELQDLLKPYAGELECYPVPREVGKVGNNEARFIAPIDSTENKQNIANFFGKQKEAAASTPTKQRPREPISDAKSSQPTGDEANPDEAPATQDAATGTKRPHADLEPDKPIPPQSPHKAAKTASSPPKPTPSSRPVRSATKNATPSPGKKAAKATDGSQRITNFFKT